MQEAEQVHVFEVEQTQSYFIHLTCLKLALPVGLQPRFSLLITAVVSEGGRKKIFQYNSSLSPKCNYIVINIFQSKSLKMHCVLGRDSASFYLFNLTVLMFSILNCVKYFCMPPRSIY